MQEELKTTAATPPQKRHRSILIAMALFFLLIGLATFILYWTYWRYRESTKDAYVNGNMVVVTAQIPGYVQTVTVDDTNYVTKGRVLVTLDPIDMMIALEKSKANLAETLRHVVSLFQKVGSLKADKEKRKAKMMRTAQDYLHRQKLLSSGGVSKEDFEHAEAAFIVSLASVMMVEHELKSARAQIENITIETHPLVKMAKEEVKRAWVNYQRCTLLAPVNGVVALKKVQVGEAINPMDPLMAIVPFDQLWVDANFKEVQLKNVRIGQSVTMTADFYGHSILYHGKVVGIPAGTGSVFSPLPPQNATGNWIKIVQRLPVRIRLDPEEVQKHPLRLGLSMHVTIDIHDREGLMIPSEAPEIALYDTDIFSSQEAGAEALIQEIVEKNLSFSFSLEDAEEVEKNP